MEAGYYVRTMAGQIGKLVDVEVYYVLGQNEKDKYSCVIFNNTITPCLILNDFITKKGKLIDLIQVGDYVNGKLVIDTYTDYIFDYSEEFKAIRFSETDILHDAKHIESIVTKEMFSSVEYRI